MRQDAPQYQAAGIAVLVIAHQGGGPVTRWLAKNPQPFPWLFDTERAAIKAYGVYNRLSYDAFHMAHPAAILIDRDGVVRFIYRCSTQWDVPKSEALLGALRSLRDS